MRCLTQDAKTIHSIHDLDGNRIAEYEIDAFDGSATLLREYVWLEGAPVAVVEGGQVYFIRTDDIGRPVFATDSAGTKVWEASYTPFGGSRPSPEPPSPSASPDSGSRANPACTRTGCGIMTQQQDDTSKQTRWGWWRA